MSAYETPEIRAYNTWVDAGRHQPRDHLQHLLLLLRLDSDMGKLGTATNDEAIAREKCGERNGCCEITELPPAI